MPTAAHDTGAVHDFPYIMEQIGKFGGQPELAGTERSLYPFFLSLTEKAAIIERLRKGYEHLVEERGVPPTDSDFAHSDLVGA